MMSQVVVKTPSKLPTAAPSESYTEHLIALERGEQRQYSARAGDVFTGRVGGGDEVAVHEVHRPVIDRVIGDPLAASKEIGTAKSPNGVSSLKEIAFSPDSVGIAL